MASAASARFFSPESLSASGRDAAKLSLPDLQSKMKCDPEGYLSELLLLYRHFDSLVLLFQEQSGLNPSTDPVVTKELADLAMLLSHVTPLYREKLSDFPSKVAELLRKSGKTLPAYLRLHLTQALILLVNRKVVGVEETLDLFMGLQILGDKSLQKAASGHIVQCIRRMNQKHKDEAKNRKLQNIMFAILQEEDEARAKRALTVLCQLHRRKIWFDERTANAICTSCFHNSSRIMIATLLILLRYESIVEEVDSEDSSSEDDTTKQKQRILLSREDVYKAHHKGTIASKKKKKAKLQRVMRSMRRQERLSLGTSDSNSYSPLTHLKDAQGFVEKLFSRLQKCNERFEVKMMMLKVIARTIGLHRLILLNFYPFLQKYVQPHQRDVTSLLAAAVQACHDMVPPDAVEPLFRQIVNQFVHDRARTEAIAVGINVVREICLRIPLLMTEDLLQDLVLYKKSHEKAISTAARSLMSLFRQICPSLLVKKDRGRPVDPKARPKAFGEASVASNVPGVDLLESAHASVSNSDNEECVSDDEDGDVVSAGTAEASFGVSDEDDSASGQVDEYTEHGIGTDKDLDGDSDDNGDDGISDENAEDTDGSDDELEIESESATDKDSASDSGDIGTEHGGNLDDDEEEEQKDHKRKFVDLDGPLDAAHASLRALKRLTVFKAQRVAADTEDGILSNEDFQRIKELQAKSEMKMALSQQGLSRKGTDSKIPSLKIPSSDDLRTKRVDPAKLEVNIKRKFTKEERLALVKAGREERGKYQSRTAVKQKKTGGLSNKQKEHKKAMPLAAKKSKVARSRQEKRKQQRRAGKQFRGKKAWK